MNFKSFLVIGTLATTVACAHSSKTTTSPETVAKIDQSLAGEQRPTEEKQRDAYRHPAQTLSFFGLKDDMTVVELYPGRGWYTAVLAPVLAEHGKLIVPMVDPNGPADGEGVKYAKALSERMQADPKAFGKVETRIQPQTGVDLGAPESADMVVTFRSLHNLDAEKLATLLDAVHGVLKPGGVFGVEDHRAKAGADPTQGHETGYLPEDWVISTIEAKGFKLAAKSEVNANPKDTKDYPEGVWTLPPTLALKDQDREKYVAIGESDRMTLRFVKK